MPIKRIKHLKPGRVSRVTREHGDMRSNAQNAVAELWPEFEAFFIAEIIRQMPENLLGLQNLISDPRVIKTRHTKEGYAFSVNALAREGRILIVWELGNIRSIPYRIYPRFKKALSFYTPNGEFYEEGTEASDRQARAWVEYRHPIPPHRFIQKAWRVAINLYRDKIKQTMVEAAFGGE